MELIILWSLQFQTRVRELFARTKMFTVLLHGFSSGLPLALSGATLQAWYTTSGVDIVTIGMLTLTGQPYVYKFFWAPILDRYSLPWLGRRRGWILIMQLCVALALGLMSLFDPALSPWMMAALALSLSTFSATQDIAIDAYRTNLLSQSERGIGTAMYSTGYRIAMLLSGGLALILASMLGWRVTYLLMSIFMLICALFTIAAPKLDQEIIPKTLRSAIIEPFKDFMTRSSVIMIILFVILYKLGDAFTLSLSTTFLLREKGFSLVDLGAIYKTVGMIATISGTLIGGLLMKRISLFKALMSFGIVQTLSCATFMILAMVGKSYGLMIGAIFLENFCGGLGSIAFVAFLMDLSNIKYTATQFAFLSAIAAIGRVFVGPVAGLMVLNLGWVQFYFWAVMIGFPSLIVLWLLRKHSVFQLNRESS